MVRDGEIVKAKGYGLSNVELNVVATPETIYQSGSVGKQFTATLVMMLVEEGKLSLDDPIGKHNGVATGTIANGVAGLYDPELALERTAIRIDPKIFDSYAGEYELASGYVLTLFREGDTFWEQVKGQQRAEILAESETTFFLKGGEARFTFVKDASGKVTHLILHQGGFDTEVKKIK